MACATALLMIFRPNPCKFQNYCLYLHSNNFKIRVNIERTVALNEAQMSILRLLGSMKTVDEVNELRQVISNYFAQKATKEMDKLWDSGEWDNEKNEAVLQEHLRTPYNVK